MEIIHELGNEKCWGSYFSSSVKNRKGILGRRKKYTKVVQNDQWKINFWFLVLHVESWEIITPILTTRKKKSWTNLKSTTLLRCIRELRSQVKLPVENWETGKPRESVITQRKAAARSWQEHLKGDGLIAGD